MNKHDKSLTYMRVLNRLKHKSKIDLKIENHIIVTGCQRSKQEIISGEGDY